MNRPLLLLLAAVILTACERQNEPPVLRAREWQAWQLPPAGASIPTPRSLATGLRDELAVLDTAGRILVYSASGQLLRSWQMLDVSVGKPEGLVVLKDGRIVVCDTHYHRLVWFDENGQWLQNTGRRGRGAGEFIYPVGITRDADENLYVCEYGGNDRVQKFTREGRWLLSFGSFGTGPGQFQRPSGLAWQAGRIYVTDAVNNRVLVYSDRGQFEGLLGNPPLAFDLPYDVALGGDALLYVIEYGAGRLSRITPDGRVLGRYGRTGSGEGEFATPWGLTIDSQQRIRVADTKNRRIVSVRF